MRTWVEVENPRQPVARINDDERMTLRRADLEREMTVGLTDGHSRGRGGAQSYNLVSESGFFELYGSGRKPEAAEFRRRVRRQVLPEIRRTGTYRLKWGRVRA